MHTLFSCCDDSFSWTLFFSVLLSKRFGVCRIFITSSSKACCTPSSVLALVSVGRKKKGGKNKNQRLHLICKPPASQTVSFKDDLKKIHEDIELVPTQRMKESHCQKKALSVTEQHTNNPWTQALLAWFHTYEQQWAFLSKLESLSSLYFPIRLQRWMKKWLNIFASLRNSLEKQHCRIEAFLLERKKKSIKSHRSHQLNIPPSAVSSKALSSIGVRQSQRRVKLKSSNTESAGN